MRVGAHEGLNGGLRAVEGYGVREGHPSGLVFLETHAEHEQDDAADDDQNERHNGNNDDNPEKNNILWLILVSYRGCNAIQCNAFTRIQCKSLFLQKNHNVLSNLLIGRGGHGVRLSLPLNAERGLSNPE